MGGNVQYLNWIVAHLSRISIIFLSQFTSLSIWTFFKGLRTDSHTTQDDQGYGPVCQPSSIFHLKYLVFFLLLRIGIFKCSSLCFMRLHNRLYDFQSHCLWMIEAAQNVNAKYGRREVDPSMPRFFNFLKRHKPHISKVYCMHIWRICGPLIV